MLAKSHVVIGVAAWIFSAPLIHAPVFDPLYLGLATVGALLPDIDHPKSWVGQRTRPISTALAAALGHRGVTHSAIAVLVLALLLLHAGYRRGSVSSVAVGYLSHLAADMLTPRGLQLAWPLTRVWRLPLCRTGSPMESVIVAVFVVCVACWFFRHGSGGMAALPHRF